VKALTYIGATVLLAATLTYPLAAQMPDNGILGYLDPKTGAFHPVSPASPADEINAATVSPTTGKFVFSFTITVASSIPSSQSIVCEAVTDVTEVSGVQSSIFDEEASTVASRSGSTATCTVTIPYSWLLATPASDTVTIRYVIGVGTTTSITSAATRSSNHNLPSIKVPANGATTTETIKATI